MQSVKKSWMEVTIKEFKEIKEITNSNKSEMDKSIEIAAVLSGLEVDDIEELAIIDLNKLIKSIEFISQPINRVNMSNTIVINSVLFSINKNISTLTVSQYLNLIEYSKDFEKNIHNILGIFVRPCKVNKSLFGTTKYKIIDVDDAENAEYIRENMSIVYCNELMLFFSEVYNSLIKYTLNLMKMMRMRMLIRMRIRRFFKLPVQKEIWDGLDVLMQFQKKLEEVGQIHTK